MNRERALWEIRNEKNKASVRWIVIAAVAGYLSYLLTRDNVGAIGAAPGLDASYIAILTVFAVTFNALLSVYLLGALQTEKISRSVKYLTMAVDFLLVALLLAPTGGDKSLFYPLNYVVIVSNALRYGMAVALAGTFLMNIFYLGVLVNQYGPHVQIPGFHQEVLKVAGFWLVGIYTGYLSRRYEILRGEVEKYQNLLSEALKKNV